MLWIDEETYVPEVPFPVATMVIGETLVSITTPKLVWLVPPTAPDDTWI
jgi:hypothetical protein